MINKEGLLAWYRQQIAKKKDSGAHAAFLFNTIWFYAMTLVLFLLIVIGLMVIRYLAYSEDLRYAMHMDHGNVEYAKALRGSLITDFNFSLFEFAVLLSFFSMAFYAHVLAKVNINRFDLMKEKGLLQPCGSENSLVNRVIEEVAVKMNIPLDRLIVWNIFNRQSFPSIAEAKDGSINLLVPPSFYSYAKKHSQKAASIIAHEFGHVLQSDTMLYAVSETYYRIIRIVFLPLVFFGFLASAFLLWKTGTGASHSSHLLLFLVLSSVILLSLLYGFYRIKKDRQKSEMLADTASILFSENNCILEVLKELESESVPSVFLHPNVAYRFTTLQNTIKKFQVALA